MKIDGRYNVADLGTKALGKERFDELCDRLNLRIIHEDGLQGLVEKKTVAAATTGPSGVLGIDARTMTLALSICEFIAQAKGEETEAKVPGLLVTLRGWTLLYIVLAAFFTGVCFAVWMLRKFRCLARLARLESAAAGPLASRGATEEDFGDFYERFTNIYDLPGPPRSLEVSMSTTEQYNVLGVTGGTEILQMMSSQRLVNRILIESSDEGSEVERFELTQGAEAAALVDTGAAESTMPTAEVPDSYPQSRRGRGGASRRGNVAAASRT